MRIKQCVHIPCRTARVVRQGHRGTAEYGDVGDHATLGQSLAESAEDILDSRAVKDGPSVAHAALIS